MVALLLAAAALATAGLAAAGDEGPRVLWASGGRLYVAVADSGAVAPGMLVRFFDHDREVGSGAVDAVLDGVVASVRLEGALDPRVRPDRLDRLDVTLEPAPVRIVPTLRVGVPAPSRRALAPPCDDAWLDKAALPRAYLDEPLGNDAVRLVADTSAAGAAFVAPAAIAWPETLLVRFYADRADEEIALERGELDAAVFWPGEPSARLRERASGFELLRGLRARGAIVVTTGRADTTAVRTAEANLAVMNGELFAGDLLPWSERPLAAPSVPAGAGPGGGPLRYEVVGFPGDQAMTRFLNRNVGTARGSFGSVTVSYRDVRTAAPDSIAAERFADGATPVFALRCPVLCSAARAPDVRALGVDRFSNLVGCVPPKDRP